MFLKGEALETVFNVDRALVLRENLLVKGEFRLPRLECLELKSPSFYAKTGVFLLSSASRVGRLRSRIWYSGLLVFVF